MIVLHVLLFCNLKINKLNWIKLSLVIFISETSVVFVISFLFLQLQRSPIHSSPANLIVVIHSTKAFRKPTWTKYSAYKILWLVSLQIHQNLNTLHQYSKNYIGFQSNNASITNCVFLHIKRFKFSNLPLYNGLSFPSHSLSTRSSDLSVLSTHRATDGPPGAVRQPYQNRDAQRNQTHTLTDLEREFFQDNFLFFSYFDNSTRYEIESAKNIFPQKKVHFENFEIVVINLNSAPKSLLGKNLY